MGRRTLLAVAVTLAILASASAAGAQSMAWRGSAGWGPDSPYGRLYNPGSMRSVTGEVTGIVQRTFMRSMTQGVLLLLKSGRETVQVHLGPLWFLEYQDFHISHGDRIEVTGSRVDFMGKPVLIASEVKKGDDTLRLRDEQGWPAWSAVLHAAAQ